MKTKGKNVTSKVTLGVLFSKQAGDKSLRDGTDVLG